MKMIQKLYDKLYTIRNGLYERDDLLKLEEELVAEADLALPDGASIATSYDEIQNDIDRRRTRVQNRITLLCNVMEFIENPFFIQKRFGG